MRIFTAKPTHAVIHSTATPPSMNVDVELVRRWHVKENGWLDIGYHWLISRAGEVYTGRDPNYVGAHCAAEGMNTKAYGIALVGGCNEQLNPESNYTFKQLRALHHFLTSEELTASAHSDHDANKPHCLGFNVREFMI